MNNESKKYRKLITSNIYVQHGADDRRMSVGSDVGQRRGTLYRRPGPPTPSKIGARLSIGGTNGELPRGDVLRESNSISKETPSTSSKSTAKKSTPGKFRNLFSSAKLKDEVRNKFLI